MVFEFVSTKTTVSSSAEPFEVKWMGVVPKHWRLLRLKTIMNERTTKGYPDEPLLSSTQKSGVILQENYEDRTVLAMKDLHLLKLVHVGDFVISLRSFQGGIEFARDRGIISPAYTVIYPKNFRHHRYLAWLFKSERFVENLKLNVTGIREGQNIDYERLSRSLIPIPPIEEQLAIAVYLDKLTLNIDAAKIQALREVRLLMEYKRAVIQQAVTRGLDPDVPLKPSGVERLGDIPEHWEVRRLKSVAELVMGQSPSSDDCSDTPVGLPFLQGCAEFGDSHPSPEQFCLSPPRVALASSILMSVRAPVGRLNVADQDYGIGRGLCGIIPDGVTLLDDFAYYQLLVMEDALRLVSTGSTYEAVSTGDVGGQVVVTPPLAEQAAIVAHLDKLTSDIDAAIAHTRREIELLEEYRTRLIADVVTGKLDVREATANLPDVNLDDIQSLPEDGETDD